MSKINRQWMGQRPAHGYKLLLNVFFRPALVALAFIGGALMSVGSNAAIIDELVEKQREAMVNEAEKKAAAGKPAPMPAPTFAATPKAKDAANIDDVRLIAIYGVGQKLTADIYYNGTIFSVTQGAETIEGWHAESIGSSRVVLRQYRSGKDKNQKRHVIYLSEATTNSTTPNAQSLPSPAQPMTALPPLPAQPAAYAVPQNVGK